MNPYKVLGVNPGDDEETVKKAYRTLVKKYHPDRYVNTPMADVATEKLKEINEAYDMITNKKFNSEQSNSYQNNRTYTEYKTNYSISFESVRMLIRLRRLDEAERMLSQLPQDAQWHYLMGLIYINRGWYDRGREFIRAAVAMDPQNMEYQQTLNSFNVQNRNYREYKTTYTSCCTPSCVNCLCTSLICSRCCC